MIKAIKNFILCPHPLRSIALNMIQKFQIGSYRQRLELGAANRPHYGHCVYTAATLAKKLGYQRMSVLEFGVAGGRGLICLEDHAQKIEKILDIEIEVYGFDTGVGLLDPVDYRDLLYLWKKGLFKMDAEKLEARLKKANLVLGKVSETSKEFFKKYNPAPIGMIAYDLDFYSSTVDALKMLEASEEFYLPRVHCYFDNTISGETELYSDYTGERLAINEFNQSHNDIKLGLPYYLLSKGIKECWHHQVWICHFFKHSRYNHFINSEDQQIPC